MTSKVHQDGQDTIISPTDVGAPRRARSTFAVRVMSGPDQGQSFRVAPADTGRVLLGLGPACAVKLTDPTVSRRHAAFDTQDDTLRLSDLGSTNGTFVNGVRAFEVELSGGETIRVGDTLLRLEPSDDVVEPAHDRTRFGALVGASEAMRRLYPMMERVAASDIPVVIEGETGTGKEVLAESLHELGPRASGPFVVFDCTTVSTNMMEAALFGHERGAFTGALNAMPGLFEQAHQGTLFIDEIGDLDILLQAKLLRAIERSEVRRIGGRGWVRVDVRVVSATRRDLDREVQAGRFRDDLFFRLAVARLELPPLRRRRSDIALLAAHFWQEMGGAPAALTGDMLQRFEDYDWPGNVRELRNAIAQRIALGDLAKPQSGGVVGGREGDGDRGPDSSADPIQEIIDRNLPFPIARDKVMEKFEERYVKHALERNGGNVTHAAHAAGIGRRYFQTIRGRTK